MVSVLRVIKLKEQNSKKRILIKLRNLLTILKLGQIKLRCFKYLCIKCFKTIKKKDV